MLRNRNLLDKTLFAKKIGLPDQMIIKASKVDEDCAPYFSLLIIREPFLSLNEKGKNSS